MKNKILAIITVLPLIVTAVALNFFQDVVPMHYDAAGNIDRWGSKYENLIFPGFIILMGLFWLLLIRYYQKKGKDSENNVKAITYAAIAQQIVFNLMQYVFLYMAFAEAQNHMTEMKLDSSKIINIIMGIFFIVLGMLVPKTKRNGTIGVRTVWSSENDKTWEESNKKGGITFVVAGILTIVESLILGGLASTMYMLAIIVVAGAVSVIFSYEAYKKYK